MCELKAWDKCVFMYDVWIEGLEYMWFVELRRVIYVSVCLMFEGKAWDIFVCTSDVELYALNIIVCMSDVWIEGLG